ncbi:MAG: 30S ribosomal protein S6 [Planctomycetota bacterium]
MKKYEGMFLLDSSRSTKDWDKVVAHVQDILTKNGAEIQLCEKWAERKLAYEIGHHKRAVYLFVVFLCPGPAIGRIRRACQLSDVIVRVLITAFDEKAKIAVEEPEGGAKPSQAASAATAEEKAEDTKETAGEEEAQEPEVAEVDEEEEVPAPEEADKDAPGQEQNPKQEKI